MSTKNPFRICVITSCTGEKLHSRENQLIKSDFEQCSSPVFEKHKAELAAYSESAEVMYTGQQHLRLMDGINRLRASRPEIDLELWIISAGYGLIPASQEIVPYECTFQGMKAAEIADWSDFLGIPQAVHELLAKRVDLCILLLGDDYLRALQLSDETVFASPTLVFVAERALAHLGGAGYCLVTPTEEDARRFACGYVGLKGELARRLFIGIAQLGLDFIKDLLKQSDTILDELAQVPVKSWLLDSVTKRSLGRVDHVINLEESWRQKEHRERLRFFIPDWDDMVDPNFDFIGERHSAGKGNWTNQVYAHQIFSEPNYDGILISKAVIEKDRRKREWVTELGIHRFLRVPQEFPIMGDCGAFSYISQDIPPYTTDEILDYYTNLGFDYGVSLDHLLFGAKTPEEAKERYHLTIRNAREFITEHRRRGLQWRPIGAIQGWNPESYAAAAQEYLEMGYEYIGIGGLVRSKTEYILEIAQAVNEVVPADMNVHLFGVARTEGLEAFIKHGVSSADSASYLRKAWMDVHRGYLTDDSAYTVLRIPYVEAVIKRLKSTVEGFSAEEETRIRDLEKQALDNIRGLAKGKVDTSACADALVEYENIARPNSHKMKPRYLRTLNERPWEACDCPICQDAGVEVIIFRGNNRNRRRGFHNTHVFYRNMQRVINGDDVHPIWLPQASQSKQLSFDFFKSTKDSL
jgi:queuine/archaeosine tRNA-ribosyltransferase